MYSWLPPRASLPTDACLLTQFSKDGFHAPAENPPPRTGCKKSSLIAFWNGKPVTPPMGILREEVSQLRPKGDPSCLVELALTYRDHLLSQIHIAQGQRCRFTDAKASAIEQTQEGAKGRGLKPALATIQDGCGSQQIFQLLGGVDIGDE